MIKVFCRSFVAGLLSLGLASLSSPGAEAQTQTQAQGQGTDTILVLDASGSMWGQVDGQSKISAARQAVDAILSKWNPADRLGVMVYGHRSKGDCKDIELMVPVSKFDPARIKAAVDGINPKGKTPISDSLRAAAEALHSTENKANVILVSDGIETCAPDPCAAAAELKKAGIGFTAHVIGLDVADPAAKSQLQCIARATGGVYLDAGNASSLTGALTKAVAATQGTKVVSEAPQKPAADPYLGKNIRGVARLAEGLDPISDEDVNWGIYKRAGDEKGEHVNTFYGAPFADNIAPGDYIAEVTYRQLKREFPLKVEKGKQAVLDVILDAGYVTSEGAVAGRAGKVDDVVWQVSDKGGRLVAQEYDAVPRFVLGAGSYVLTLTKGQSKTSKPFSVAAGDASNVQLTLDVGKLIVTSTYAEGGPKVEKDIVVAVYQPSKADGDEGEKVAQEYDAESKFDLPSGSYDVTAVVGEAKGTVRAEVKSGAPTRINVNLNAGVVGIKTDGAQEIDILSAERDLNDERKRISVSYDAAYNVALGAGDYVAVAIYADGQKVEKPFSIAAGKRQTVEIKQ
ncbi:VWA domain-containing protein [Bradyrhizobium sp. Ce-3]|uniref:vWA domain-containing protein n=1 Tax=Bradyrhizobium sp. Ce-3 TaxID=2913970 RepID=UPI001FC7F2A4|nr:vWA domain-containing protein [Bradyrhizobium sp. Ce-3]GKQ56029.1 VWA domain-containing protein [Bradyrhizobium sp. Ce-3]